LHFAHVIEITFFFKDAIFVHEYCSTVSVVLLILYVGKSALKL